ncbi:hypothetical protein PHMEG_00011603 [Phytophthora megakarya]|uniref:Uncharacterized protein n=1 Tax=Phytophthora megakarya TaxID=4795 RepID=A0A225WBT1_9STRA|nr:hypothetical protein PHMEG_00011603 [Phytophthora megakarya]
MLRMAKKAVRNTSMQYYLQAKLWLLEQLLQHQAALEARLLKMEKPLDGFRMKRDGGGLHLHAPRVI